MGHGENQLRCRVTDHIDDPFSRTLLLRPADRPDGIPFGCTVPREVQEKDLQTEADFYIPKERILLLQD